VNADLLRRFGLERRRIVSQWRILIEIRRIAQAQALPLPEETQARKTLQELLRRNLLVPIEGVPGVYRVDVPFADVIPISEEQIVQEANPLAVFSHLTALAHHALTDQIPKAVQATHYTPANPERIPLGTAPEEWSGLNLPPLRRPTLVEKVRAIWFLTKGVWDFGHVVSYSQGLPIYITDVERTLIDVIRSPRDAGGITVALRGWRSARSTANLDRLIDYTERFEQPLLRQRIGFLLEALGLTHKKLADWKQHLIRGGSVKLVASLPYAPVFSADWNLSLNVPESVLAELQEE
jgi:predicted transcriptional regulator of viral defense system